MIGIFWNYNKIYFYLKDCLWNFLKYVSLIDSIKETNERLIFVNFILILTLKNLNKLVLNLYFNFNFLIYEIRKLKPVSRSIMHYRSASRSIMHYRSANINFMYILLFLNKLVLNIYFNFIIYDIMLLAPIGCEWKKAFFEDPNYDLNNRYRNILAIFAENITFDMIYHAHFCYIFPCFLSIDIDFIMSNKFGICDKTLTIYSKIYYESNEVVESIIWLMNFIIQEYDLVEFIQLRIKRYLNKKIKPL